MKKVIAITGPSGAGKTTLSNFLREKFNFPYPIHTTTRSKRDDDEIGFYNYISVYEFEEKVKNDEFLFFSGYKNRYYGILKNDYYNALNHHEGIIINVNYMDLNQIKEFKEKENIIIIQLTFKNIEKMIKERTAQRNQKKEDTHFRIEVAVRNEKKYENEINSMVDIVCYTDKMDFEEETKFILKEIDKYYDSKRN